MQVFTAEGLLTLVIKMYVLVGNSDTSLLLLLKGHVDKLVDSDWML